MLWRRNGKDFAKGAEWLTKAALQGNAPAQYNLGRMYQWGKGVEKTYNKPGSGSKKL
uniref:Sel1 repeat family protein n=1 Tax=uncultured bacterium 52B7 TaxID=933047 RepID=E5KWN4_9BACT|nr:hypothetical protein [uncultured bacterium 52B7]